MQDFSIPPKAARFYLDHAATTPLRPEAAEAIQSGFALWANPSSPHAQGRAARRALEDARERIKNALGWEGEVIFTSGASEAAAIAFSQAKAGERLVSAVEHDAILNAAPGATPLVVGTDGALDLYFAARELSATSHALVAVQTINPETGNQQDIPSIASIVQGAGGLLLTDASQSAGKYSLPPEADMAIISAHKLGGPVGIGALLIKDYALLEPAGGQERGYRRGTENLPAVLGLAAALEACPQPFIAPSILAPLEELATEVRALGGLWFNDILAHPTDYIAALAMPVLSGSAQLMRFDMQGIAVSQGSACSSGSLKTSHVLGAMGLPSDVASRTIRVSFGWTTTRAEIERFAQSWLDLARQTINHAA